MIEPSKNYRGRYLCTNCKCLVTPIGRKCVNLRCLHYAGSLK